MSYFNKNTVKWLIPTTQIGRAFHEAYTVVIELYRQYSSGTLPNVTYYLNNFFKSSVINYLGWKRADFAALIACCTDDPNAKFADVHPEFRLCNPKQEVAMANFFKMVLTLMWLRKQVVLPLSVRSVTNLDSVLDKVISLGEIDLLKSIREHLRYDELHATAKERDLNKRLYTRWTKLLLSGQVYCAGDLTPEYCMAVYREGTGRKKPLVQYRVFQMLHFIAGEDASARQMVDEAVSTVRRQNAEAQKIDRESRKKPEAPSPSDRALSLAIEYGNGKRLLHLSSLFADVVKPYRLKSMFDKAEGSKKLYSALPKKVAKFCAHLDETFRSYVKSKRLQREKNYILLLNLILAYLSTYLPNFFLARDGHLRDYPASLNDFDCTLYFTREANFVNGVLVFTKVPPMTFLRFLEEFAKFNKWGNDTWYARVLCADEYCEWVEENRFTLAKADRFSNNFSSACYPPVKRRNGTVKRPIPRAYFGAFLSILYSLEYLVMHLNLMADGVMPGLVRGKLYQPSLAELQESSEWQSMWGKGDGPLTIIDQTKLNYCPIFYSDGKIYALKFIPRFYRILEYELDGRLQQRVVPNHVRLTQLMCETGLRQQHIIWLDKDRYDCMLDRSSKSQLAPLFVSSDKSHGEWTAIVGRHIMAVLDRQRKWYARCTAPGYEGKLWYGMKIDSKFGQFRPLFRMPLEKAEGWANYRFYPVMLSILQYFIHCQLKDEQITELVVVRASKWGEETAVEFTEEYFSKITVDDLVSDYTPHGLRAGFVSEAVRFLPAWIVGQYMTGQTEPHVWYYTVFEEDDLPSHQRLLANYLLKNTDSLNAADAPELAAAVIKLNERLAADIKADPVKAIKTHGLISLIGVKEDQTGIEVMRAKKGTGFAFNPTHICPFNNKCPKEVIEELGAGRPCGLCQYAIRGVSHLPAISAEKDKFKEEMAAVLRKLKHYKNLKRSATDRQVIENLNQDHDTYAREAYSCEAIEQQLYQMALGGQHSGFFVARKDELLEHFKRVELTDAEYVVKRLIDVQNFPDATSSELDTKFAYLRAVLLMREGDLESVLSVSEHTPGVALASQIGSMVNSGAMDVMDVFRISQAAAKPLVPERPDLLITKRIGHSHVEEKDAEPEEGHIR
ncbi:hypothetical protein [Pseudomonas sp. ICMP 561]|uniref:hypothetical protein n=1 Tax=Pseudomonas sp. ICMP 561 TaxID=1718918 RepID=UPI000C084FCC|nr:hypothetical protein [Pseudomonas sp. ICMP 561]PHN17222.1 hypothetical protein AO242_21255 [Pseudomonas sp. ICMP 561]